MITSTNPNTDQLEFLAQCGVRHPGTGEMGLSDPSGVDELLSAVEEGRAHLVGSNVVGSLCEQATVDAIEANLLNFKGNIIDGPETTLSSTLRLVGCTILNAELKGNSTVTGGTFEAGTTSISGETKLLPRIVIQKAGLPRLDIDPNTRGVTVGKNEVHITKIEFILLEHLSNNVDRTVPRDELHALMGAVVGKSHVVDVHLSNLRRKLVQLGLPNLYKTVRGVGFLITED